MRGYVIQTPIKIDHHGENVFFYYEIANNFIDGINFAPVLIIEFDLMSVI